jgi:hypothetical protein
LEEEWIGAIEVGDLNAQRELAENAAFLFYVLRQSAWF